MQRGDIIKMISEKRVDTIARPEEIASLVEKYPYCSAFRVLDAISAKEIDSIDQKTKLNLASIYIQDRSKLYDYIVKNTVQKAIESSVKDEILVEKGDDVGINSENETSEINNERSDSFSDVHETKETPKIPLELKNSTEISNLSISSQPLEEEIMREAIMHIGELEVGYSLEELDEEKEKWGEVEQPISQSEKTKISKPTEKMSFGSWLLSMKEPEIQEPKNENRAIIDKFIQESPQISPVKTTFFSPSQMGKMSLVDDESFVTETLAGIYEKQGDFKKAAKAYQNLSLKYPEKRSYFAALQKKAEEKFKK